MKFPALVMGVGLCLGSSAPAFAAVTNRVIATSGDHLPGAPNDIVFDQTLSSGLKAINGRGDVVFIAPLRSTNTGSLVDDNALLLAGTNGLQTVARTGEAIPAISGAQFGAFRALALNDAGELAIRDLVSFDDRLLANLAGAWQIVARNATPAPNPPGGTFSQIFATPQIGGTPVVRQSGVPQWLFQASTFSPGLQSGFWNVNASLQPYRALVFSSQAPGLSGGELLESNHLAAASPPPLGKVSLQGFLRIAGAVNHANRQILYRGDGPENLQVLFRSGQARPASLGTGNWSGFRGFDGNQNGEHCFIADWSPFESGVFLVGTSDPVLLVKRDDIAPAGYGDPDGYFNIFTDSAINAAGQVVFKASVGRMPGSDSPFYFDALYRWTTGVLKLIVRTGTNSTWQGAPAGWSFNSIQQWNVNASGAVAFFGYARNTAGTQRGGLWVVAGDQGPQLVAHTGIPFTTPPEGVVALSQLRDLNPFAQPPPASGGADGRARFLADSSNTVVFAGDFPLPITNTAIFASQVSGTNIVAPVAMVPEYIITTVAGDGTSGYSGDGGPAVLAKFSRLRDIAVDASGQLYIADREAYRVRKVGSNGIITTVVGIGTPGFSGDGGLATLAQIAITPSVAVDGGGNLYLAEAGYNDGVTSLPGRIRQVDANGIITTLAGTGIGGFSGDGGPATNAMVRIPTGVKVDAQGRVYFYDSGNFRVRRVDTNGIIQTFAGNGTNGFSGENGPATNAAISIPTSQSVAPMAIDGVGHLYFIQAGTARIRKVDTNGIITSVVAGETIGRPDGLAVDRAGNLFIADGSGRRILRMDTNGVLAVIAGNGSSGFSGDGGPALAASLEGLDNLVMDGNGNVFFITGQRVRRLSPSGNLLPAVPRYASTPAGGSLIDLGKVSFLDGTNVGFGVRKSITISNTGISDLRIDSVSIANPSNHFHIAASTDGYSGDMDRYPASFPYVIPASVQDGALYIHLDPNVPAMPPGFGTNIVRVVSNDPDTPVVDYIVRAEYDYTYSDTNVAVAEVETEIEHGFFSFFRVAGRGLSARGPVTASQMLVGNETATFSLDPAQAQSLTAGIPGFLGDGIVQFSNLTGTVTVTLKPIANDTNHARLLILAGEFAAASVRLPSGIQTGPNHLTFGPASVSDGIITLSNNQFTVTTLALITNDLFPEGIPVRGSYTGTYNETNGHASAQSQSIDYIFPSEALQILARTNDRALAWNLPGYLERATNVLGPWTTLSNAASPFPVNTAQEPQQFFRVRATP